MMLPDLEQLKTAVWLYDFDSFSIRWANAAGIALWNAESLDELCARNFQPETSDAVRETLDLMKSELLAGKVLNKVWQLSPKGKAVNVFCRFSPYYLDGSLIMLCEGTPVNLFEAYAEISATTSLSTFTLDGAFTSANPSFTEEIGAEIQHIRDFSTNEANCREIIQCVSANGRFEQDLLLRTPIGDRWFHTTAIKSIDQHGETTILMQLINIHRRKMHEINLTYESTRDALTGLFNRRGLKQELSKLTESRQSLVLFYIDLDGFKIINDTFGHTVGDDLLKAVAKRLTSTELSKGLAGRIGGDEFIWACYQDRLPCDEQRLGEQLVTSLSETYYTGDGHPLTVSASVGIAHFPEDGTTVDNLIVSADTAMYFAKRRGKRRHIRFKAGMESDIRRRSYLVQHLHKAEQKHELAVNYQSIIDADSNEVIAYEALLRWTNATLGEVTPTEAIQVAEDTGIINELEKWVFSRAIDDLPQLRRNNGNDAKLSINVSGRHLSDTSLIPYISQCLKKAALSPADICIELTESVLLAHLNLEHNPIQILSELGFCISIDDFGTGYSSLSYLHCIPAHVVKIDRSFVMRLPLSEPTVKSIHELIKSLGMITVAEGVENEMQKNSLLALGIRLQQGFFHATPRALESMNNDS